LGHTHDAIIYYKKLLNAHSNLLENDCQPPAYWNEKLHFAIHLNLSIAYKTVGRITDALEHALIYVKLTEPLTEDKSLVAQAYCNAGTLFDMLGKPHEAMDFYKKYLQACKQDGGKNKRAQAQAYGCLGSSYAQLGNETMAVTMHQQQLSAIKQFHDHILTAVAYELLGDSFMSLENWSKAAESYDTAIKCLKSADVKAKAAMLCKLGNAYRQQRLCGHALQVYEQAEKLSRDSSQFNVSVVSKLNIAICLQESSRMQELERALEYFDFVLPILEAKRCQHYEEDTFCPSQLNTQLRDCYNGMQAVYGRLDKKARCLEIAETFRRKELEAYITGSVSCALCSPGDEVRTIECLTGIVDRQDSVIVYYSLLSIGLLTWVLKPGEGLARFYMKRNETNDTPVAEVLRKLMKELIKDLSVHVSTSAMSCENRSLPFRNTDLLIERKENKSFSTASRRECIAAELDNELSSPECQQEQPSDDSAKPRSVSRQLFSILLAPVYDLLFSLPAGSPVTIIPDDILCNCPFHVLEDWSGVQLESKFRITIAPCLLAVNKCFDNEVNFRTREDNLLLDRQQARHGGPVVASILDATTLAKAHEPLPSSRKLLPSLTPRANGTSKPNSKTLSNPRLSRSTPLPNPSAIKKVTPQNYNDSHALAKALGTHTVSTLCVRTETNTDIIRSDLCVHEFRQVSNKQRVAVIGSPVLKGKYVIRLFLSFFI
jgi:tetratricopeptide (TPR) repeat protein